MTPDNQRGIIATSSPDSSHEEPADPQWQLRVYACARYSHLLPRRPAPAHLAWPGLPAFMEAHGS
jgi:hypothetical protein